MTLAGLAEGPNTVSSRRRSLSSTSESEEGLRWHKLLSFRNATEENNTRSTRGYGQEDRTHLGPSALEMVGIDWPSHCMPLVAQLEHGCPRSHFNFLDLQKLQEIWGCLRGRGPFPLPGPSFDSRRRFIFIMYPESIFAWVRGLEQVERRRALRKGGPRMIRMMY